jgi:hypothetical protein
VLLNILVESWNIKLCEQIVVFWEPLKREEMLKDDTARLEEHMAEAFLPVCRLEDSEAA